MILAASPAVIPPRSQIEEWSTQHLTDAATSWRSAATTAEVAFDQHRANISSPGGTDWEGDAKDAAFAKVVSDLAVVGRQSDLLRVAAAVAENGVTDINAAKREALAAIEAAENDGFGVGEDLSVTDTRKVDVVTAAARQSAADEHAEDIRWTAERLAQADAHVGSRLLALAAELEGIQFDGEGGGDPRIRRVDHHEIDAFGSDADKRDWRNLLLPSESSTDTTSGAPTEADAHGTEDGLKSSLVELLEPDKPTAPLQPPNLDDALDEVAGQPVPGHPTPAEQILDHYKRTGSPGTTRYTKSPLEAPIVEADPSVIEQQRLRVEAARANLDAAQADMDAAARGAYTQGAGAGPGRGETAPLGQAVFDARAELTKQDEILQNLTAAAAETGTPTASVPDLPPNAHVQAYPSEPPMFERATDALVEGTKDAAKNVWDVTMPDVVNMYEVATDWEHASQADKIQAATDAAGMVPLPGSKFLGEGIEHGLDALGVGGRHVDDVPTMSADDIPGATHHTPSEAAGPHVGDAASHHSNVDATAPVSSGPHPLPPDSPLFDNYQHTPPGPEFTRSDGSLIYPDDSLPSKPYAVQGTVISNAELPSGSRLDRFGYPGGSWVSPEGVPFAERSLPPGSVDKPYFKYEVNAEVGLPPGWRIEQSQAAPWFHQPGGGIQYRVLDDTGNNGSVEELVRWGYLREVD
ncbi:TNT domain-containing protein [Mycolicibacterium thermoresistibile]